MTALTGGGGLLNLLMPLTEAPHKALLRRRVFKLYFGETQEDF